MMVNENSPSLSDVEIHHYLKTRQPLKFSDPNLFRDGVPEERLKTYEQVFGCTDIYGVLDGCQQVNDHWDYLSKPPFIPIVRASADLSHDNPDSGSCGPDGRYIVNVRPDTTKNILRRIPGSETLCCENRKHLRLIFETLGVPITWFSCRREFINAMMGTVIGGARAIFSIPC